MKQLELIKESSFWLFSIAVSLITLSIHLTMKSESTDLSSTTVLFWVVVLSQLWKKRHALNLHSGIFSSFLGASLIIAVLCKSLSGYIDDSFLRFSPILSFLGFALLASGIQGLKQYWQELSLLGFLIIPQYWLSQLTDLSILTTKFAAFVLHYFGLPAQSNQFQLVLPPRSVEVNYGCSGIEVDYGCSGADLIFQLLGLTLIFLVISPPQKSKALKILTVTAVSVILGFVINGMRVALMAFLCTYSQKSAFDYWHQGNGSLIFSLVAVLIFGLTYQFLIKLPQADKR